MLRPSAISSRWTTLLHSSKRYSANQFQNTFSTSSIRSHGRLHNRACIVTGGSSGIGLAIAQAFVRAGASKVIVLGRNQERLQSAVESLKAIRRETVGEEAANGESDVVYSVSSASSADPSMWTDLFKSHSDVNVLVNAAGVSHSAVLSSQSDTHITETINTNLTMPIYASRAIIKNYTRARLRARKSRDSNTDTTLPRSACIINISSLLAEKGVPGTSVYASTKAALIALTRTLAVEVGTLRDLNDPSSAIRVNALMPGYIETPMLDAMGDTAVQDAVSKVPLKRLGTVEEVADAAVFLASNEFVNGATLCVDGGLGAT